MNNLLHFGQLRDNLTSLFETIPFPDFGWWLITRDHISLAELVTACQFIYSLKGDKYINLSPDNYNQLHQALGRTVPEGGAGQTLRRHLFLNMVSPLCLLERKYPGRWDSVRLAHAGVQIAQGYPPSLALENQLQQIKFAQQPWSPKDRANRYSAFSVSPHYVLLNVLKRCEGWLDRTEYRLFVARHRKNIGLQSVIRNIHSFRILLPEQQRELLELEKNLFGNARKKYSNWCDMDLHIFSLMSLGTTFLRIRNQLVLAEHTKDRPQQIVVGQATTPQQIELRQPPSSPDFSTPPPPPIQGNTGYYAETLVASLFRAEGYEVVEYTRVKGYGFDLWVKNINTNNVFFIEVKSSQGQMSSLTLTAAEFQAARQYREHYLVFIVEEIDQPSQSIWVVQNPAQRIPTLNTPKQTVEHRAARSSWLGAAQQYSR